MTVYLSPRKSLLALALIACTSLALADDHAYQVTGPILSLTDTTITVQKAGKPWSVSRDASTKITGDLVVGAKVTIHYHMVANDVSVKAAK